MANGSGAVISWHERTVSLGTLLVAVLGMLGGVTMTLVIATQGFEQRMAAIVKDDALTHYQLDMLEKRFELQAEAQKTAATETRVLLDSISADIQMVIVKLAVHEGKEPVLPKKPRLSR